MVWFWISLLIGCILAYNPEENADIDDTNLFEGDMILSPEQQRAALNGGDVDTPLGRGSVKNKRWPGGVMVYTIDSSLAREPRAVSAVEAGMDEWTKHTCITFKKRTTETAYVRFILGYGCSSHVGRLGVRQSISLRRGCWKKFVVVHEIGHALGFYHEQSRPDRDEYVTIMWDNILESQKRNFKKYNRATIDSLGTAYDYGSVMHYKADGFSTYGEPTIVPKKPGVTIGQRKRISPIDAQQMNLLYKGECSGGGGGGIVTSSPTEMAKTTAAPSSCVDKSKDCMYWKRFCNQGVSFVKENCKKTCNRC